MKKIGFWDCEYQIDGNKIEDGESKCFITEPKETKNDKFEYFNPFENEEVDWIKLNIFVLPKQIIKYNYNK